MTEKDSKILDVVIEALKREKLLIEPSVDYYECTTEGCKAVERILTSAYYRLMSEEGGDLVGSNKKAIQEFADAVLADYEGPVGVLCKFYFEEMNQ